MASNQFTNFSDLTTVKNIKWHQYYCGAQNFNRNINFVEILKYNWILSYWQQFICIVLLFNKV